MAFGGVSGGGIMLYKCIWEGCTKVWGEPEPGNEGFSHGLCPTHSRLAFTDVFRRQQAKEGNPDCYLRCFGNCQRHWCTFHPLCAVDEPGPEHLMELQSRLEARLNSFQYHANHLTHDRSARQE
jgi:hypothetical protein